MTNKLGGKYTAPPFSIPGGEELNAEKSDSERNESPNVEKNRVEEIDDLTEITEFVFDAENGKELEAYHCDKCSFTSNTKNAIKTHKGEKHTVKDSFNCKQCDFTAEFRVLLRRHELKEHKERIFPCDKCDFTATSEDILRTHDQFHCFEETNVDKGDGNSNSEIDKVIDDEENITIVTEVAEVSTKKKTKKEYLSEKVKDKAISRSNKVNIKSFKDKYLTSKKKTSSLQREHGSSPDYILFVRNNIQKPGGKNSSSTAGKYLVYGEGPIQDDFFGIHGVKFDKSKHIIMKNDYNMEEKQIEEDSEPESEESDHLEEEELL